MQPALDPRVGRAVNIGNAPPFGQAQRWALGNGIHRLAQGYDGSIINLSWLRLAAVNALGMQRVLPGPYNMGVFGRFFLNEYPEDHCEDYDPSSEPTNQERQDYYIPAGDDRDYEQWAVARRWT